MESITWSPGVKIADIERQVIERAFAFYRQNKSATAVALGISIRTLEHRFEAYKEQDKVELANEERRKSEREIQLRRHRGLQPELPGHPAAPSNHGSAVDSRAALAHARNGKTPQPGMGMESTQNTAAQQPMPLPQRKEIQEVLPEKASRVGSSRRG